MIGGCAPIYKTTSTGYDIDKTKPVSVFLLSDPKPEDGFFAKILANSLRKNGFNVSDNGECGFAFGLDEPTYAYQGSYTTYNTSNVTTNTSGYVGNTYFSGNTTSKITIPQTHHYTYYQTYKKIYVSFACLDKNNKADYIWEGFVSARIQQYDKNKEAIINNLTELVGITYNGYLPYSGNVKKFIQHQSKKNWLFLNFDVGYGYAAAQANHHIPLGNYGFYDDIAGIEDILYSALTNARIGYARQFSENYFFGVNAFYNYNIFDGGDIKINSGQFVLGKTFYSPLNKASFKNKHYGLEATLYIDDFIDNLGLILFGVGIGKGDVTISYPVKSDSITKDISFVYVPIRLGYWYNIPATNFYFTQELTTNLPIGENYILNIFTYNIGVAYKLGLF